MSLLGALLELVRAAPLQAASNYVQCTSVMKGLKMDDMVTLPTVSIPSGIQNAVIEINNACEQRYLAGHRVTVCDHSPPVLIVADEFLAFPLQVYRNSHDSPT